MPALLDKRLIFVTGKGGVGKSTVAAALGVLGARQGLRTVIAELSSQERVQRLFGCIGRQFEEVQLRPGCSRSRSIPSTRWTSTCGSRSGALGHALGSSRLFQAFAMATPGMRELLSIGKVWELAQLERRTHGAAPYDLVIVDAPATGHGVGLLRTPRTFAEIARVGPIAHQGRTIADTIADRSFTGVVAVATPEEIPVNETLSLCETLEDEQLAVDLVVAQRPLPDALRGAARSKRWAARWSAAARSSRARRCARRSPSTPVPRPSASSPRACRRASTGASPSFRTCSPSSSAPREVDLLADALAERLDGGVR